MWEGCARLCGIWRLGHALWSLSAGVSQLAPCESPHVSVKLGSCSVAAVRPFALRCPFPFPPRPAQTDPLSPAPTLGGGLGGTRRGGADVNIRHSGRDDTSRYDER